MAIVRNLTPPGGIEFIDPLGNLADVCIRLGEDAVPHGSLASEGLQNILSGTAQQTAVADCKRSALQKLDQIKDLDTQHPFRFNISHPAKPQSVIEAYELWNEALSQGRLITETANARLQPNLQKMRDGLTRLDIKQEQHYWGLTFSNHLSEILLFLQNYFSDQMRLLMQAGQSFRFASFGLGSLNLNDSHPIWYTCSLANIIVKELNRAKTSKMSHISFEPWDFIALLKSSQKDASVLKIDLEVYDLDEDALEALKTMKYHVIPSYNASGQVFPENSAERFITDIQLGAFSKKKTKKVRLEPRDKLFRVGNIDFQRGMYAWLCQIPSQWKQALQTRVCDIGISKLASAQKLQTAFFTQIAYLMNDTLARASLVKIIDRIHVNGCLVTDVCLTPEEQVLLGIKRIYSMDFTTGESGFTGERDRYVFVYQKIEDSQVITDFVKRIYTIQNV